MRKKIPKNYDVLKCVLKCVFQTHLLTSSFKTKCIFKVNNMLFIKIINIKVDVKF